MRRLVVGDGLGDRGIEVLRLHELPLRVRAGLVDQVSVGEQSLDEALHELPVLGLGERLGAEEVVHLVDDDLERDVLRLPVGAGASWADPLQLAVSGQPLCWLDFEHAGRNALASDAANFLWYLLGMGGWLVPIYQPAVYASTLRFPARPSATPVIDDLHVTDRRIEIDCTWHAGAGRHAAIAALTHRLGSDLGSALAPDGDVEATLRPFLALRILSVIPLGWLSGPHALACLTKLAELTQPAWSLPGWCATCPPASAATLPAGGCLCHGGQETRPEESSMTDRVRALLVTPDGGILTIRRIRPGQEPYSVLPGGGVEEEDHQTALARELREEIAATADVHSLLYILGQGSDRQYIYLARSRSWSASPQDRSGPEFTDPTRGDYQLRVVPLTTQAVESINLKPDALAEFLLNHLRHGDDLFALPDLQTAGSPSQSSP